MHKLQDMKFLWPDLWLEGLVTDDANTKDNDAERQHTTDNSQLGSLAFIPNES